MSRAAWSISSSRRTSLALLLTGGALAALPGCGFRPLYGESGGAGGVAAEAPVQAELAAIRVALIPERSGQLLRRALEERLRGNGPSAAPRYDLRVSLLFAAEPLGFRRDGTPSRVRYRATANWWLVNRATPPVQVARGTETEIDAYNIPDQQFFAADTSRDAMERRMIQQVAFTIAQRLAVTLRQRTAATTAEAAPAPAGAGATAASPASGGMPRG